MSKSYRTVDARPNAQTLVKPGELVDLVEVTPLTLADRRIYNQLLENAWDAIEKPVTHVISKSDLRGSHNSNDRVGASIERLMASIVKIQIMRDGEPAIERVQLLGGNVETTRRDGLLEYEIPFEDVAGPWEDGGGVFEFPMNTNSGDGIPVLMTFSDNLVNQIVITVDLCLSNMLVEYGEPDEVVVEDSYYYFLYHNLGLFLSTSDEFGLDRISTIFVVNVAPIINLVDRGNSLGWDDFADSLILDC